MGAFLVAWSETVTVEVSNKLKLRSCQRLTEHHGTEHGHYRKKVIGSTNQQMGTGL